MRTYSFSDALDRHPEIRGRPVTIGALQQRFRPDPRRSARALVLKMGPFVARTDGFGFENDFPITGEIAAQFLSLVGDEVIEEVVRAASLGYADFLNDLRIPNPVPLLPDISLPSFVIDIVLNRVLVELAGGLTDLIIDPVGSNYGRCGGMAFAGYDLYQRGWPVAGFGTGIPAEDSPLDEYILRRLLDSLDRNVKKFLDWIIVLHVMPKVDEIATAALLGAAGGPLGAAIGLLIGSKVDIFRLGGAKTLHGRTKREWQVLKQRLDEQAAWPLGLIYKNKKSPFDQHQVLAIGYEDSGLGTARLRIWDNEDGAEHRDLAIDFRDDELKVTGHSNVVKGFFVESYAVRKPPESLNLS